MYNTNIQDHEVNRNSIIYGYVMHFCIKRKFAKCKG